MSTYAGVTSRIASQLGLGRASGERILAEVKRLQDGAAVGSGALSQIALAVGLKPDATLMTIVDQVEFVRRKAVNNAGRSDSQEKFLRDIAEAAGFGPEVPYVTVLAEVRRMAEDIDTASGFHQHLLASFDKLAKLVKVERGDLDTPEMVTDEVERLVKAEEGLLHWKVASDKHWAELFEVAGIRSPDVTSKGQLIEYVKSLKRKQLSPVASAMIVSTLRALIGLNETSGEQLNDVLEALK